MREHCCACLPFVCYVLVELSVYSCFFVIIDLIVRSATSYFAKSVCEQRHPFKGKCAMVHAIPTILCM